MSRSSDAGRGFTLIEVLLTMVIISVGLSGVMVLYYNATRGIMAGDVNLMATYLAREKLEKLVCDKSEYGYDYVKNEQYAISEEIVIGNGQHFTRSFNIYDVNKDDLITPEISTGYKKIDMVVSWGVGGEERIALSTILTSY